tara:strand:+ start:6253 stop:8613 length:2361 start_codon:yes stop_codon:yes gene_type:complete
MFNIALLFSLLFTKGLASYTKVECNNLSLFVHEDFFIDDINVNHVNEIYSHINKYLNLEYGNFDIYITTYDLSTKISPLPNSREKDPSSVVKIVNFKEYDIFDSDSFDFLFCYELSKQLIREKAKQSLQKSISYIDVLYPIKEKLTSLFFHDWLVEGLALFIARDYSVNSDKNKKLMDRFVRESAGAINSTFVEKGVTPGMIFDKLREDDFYLKYLFADFLSYLLKRHGFEKFNITMKRLFYLKDKRAFNSGPMHCFVDVYSPTIFWEWWSIIEKKEGRYPARGSYRKIFQIQSGNHIFFLSSTGRVTNLMDDKFKVRVGDVAHFDLDGDNIYYTSARIDFNNDKLTYDLYKDGSLVASNTSERFFVSEGSIYWIENRGLRDRIYKDNEELLSLDKGIKVEKAFIYKDNLIISGSREGSSTKIFNLTRGIEICEGHAPFVHRGNLYFVSNEDDSVYQLDIYSKNKKLIYVGEVTEATYYKNKLHVISPIFRGSVLKEVDAIVNSTSDRVSPSNMRIVSGEENRVINVSNDISRVYPDFNIFYPSFTLSLHNLKGSILKAKTLYVDAYWDIIETVMEGNFNPKLKLGMNFPISVTRQLYLVTGAELGVSLKDGARDNNAKLIFNFKKGRHSLAFLPKIGTRGENVGKLGFSVLMKSNVYFHFHHGFIGEESTIPEFRWYKLVDLRKIEGTSYFVMGVRDSIKFDVNLIVAPYKFKIDTLRVGAFVYLTEDFVRREEKFNYGLSLDFGLKIYGWDIFLNNLIVADQSSHELFKEIPTLNFAFNYEIKF